MFLSLESLSLRNVPDNNLMECSPTLQFIQLISVYFVPAIACGFVKPLSALSYAAGHPPSISMNPVPRQLAQCKSRRLFDIFRLTAAVHFSPPFHITFSITSLHNTSYSLDVSFCIFTAKIFYIVYYIIARPYCCIALKY